MHGFPVEPEKSIAAVIGGNSSARGRRGSLFLPGRTAEAQHAVNLFLCGFNTGARALRASSASFSSLHETAHSLLPPPPSSFSGTVAKTLKRSGARLDGGRRVINSENGARYYVKLHDVTAGEPGQSRCPHDDYEIKSCAITRKSWGREKSTSVMASVEHTSVQ